MKILLYCTKGKPYLYDQIGIRNILDKKYKTFNIKQFNGLNSLLLNGKIVAECDFEVEDIYYGYEIDDFWTKTCGSQKDFNHNLLKQSCLEHEEMYDYLQPKDSYYGICGYAIHIKNLKIFNKPRELSDYEDEWEYPLKKAPQNMRRCYSTLYSTIEADMPIRTYSYILISICPELMCKILNGECTIIIKKKVLKGMIENDK